MNDSTSNAPPRVNSKTQLVGLIGWPVGHSVSPRMHNVAFAATGLDWCYLPLPVPTTPATRIGEAVLGLRALGLRGANVTVPHKQAVMPFLDALSPAARAMGAVNTIIVHADGTLAGDNTDAPGFVADLQAHGVAVAGKRVLILGAGGSARAVVYGLGQAGAASISLVNRTIARAHELVDALQSHVPACRLDAGTLPDDLAALADDADIIVNTTSLGMSPNIDTSPWPTTQPLRPSHVVYDLVYNPRETRLLAHAQQHGAQAIGGIGMLVWQGALAFEHWTGIRPPVELMRQAIGA
jgi:shikimate dehydrogenase